MALPPGTRIGRYEILSVIGLGGMGEVYRARETSLKRDVALKILPERFSAGVVRLARFQREAQVLSSLNQSNIASIYALEGADGARARRHPSRPQAGQHQGASGRLVDHVIVFGRR